MRFSKELIGAALVSAALALTGSSAHATPLLQIVGTTAANGEVIGDPGGTHFPQQNPSPNDGGPGLPTDLGGWPVGPGFAQDPSSGNNLGISGWHGANLLLTEGTAVIFQYMGQGDSSLANRFQVSLDGGLTWTTIFDQSNPFPVGAAGNPPVITGTDGVNQLTLNLAAGILPFRFVTGNDVIVTNGFNNDDITHLPGFFLGVDPYLATAPFQDSGTVVYAGLTDLPQGGDHDFQDLGVRISVLGPGTHIPEPGMLALAGTALVALAGRRRRAR